MTGPWAPPSTDRALGLDFFATASAPIAARIKADPDDFHVTEVSAYPRPAVDGPFTVLTVRSRDWEQHELGERIARALRLAPNAIAWAGTKDRRAVAERLASYRGMPPSGPIEIPRVEIVDAYRARDGLSLGHHFGNAFAIRLAGPTAEEGLAEAVAAPLRELRAAGGFPNFFGPQRFGEVRPVTHLVGRRIVAGDLDGAVETYLTEVVDPSDRLGVEARRAYADHRDPVRALREFPPQFRFERQLLDHLAQGHGAARALRSLSRNLRLLFVHAFQSLLFNRWLSARHAEALPLDRPVAGDRVLRVAVDGTTPGAEAVEVSADNVEEVADTVARGRARLAGPLVGYATPRGFGAPGAILERLLDEEGVARERFRLPEFPEVASAGTWRPAWVDLPPVGVRGDRRPELGPDLEDGAWLTFALPKGTYATVLLREVLKTGAIATG